MKNKAIILVIFTVVIFALGAFVGRLTNKPKPEITLTAHRIIDSLKTEIADMRNIRLNDSLRVRVEYRTDTLYLSMKRKEKPTHDSLVMKEWFRWISINKQIDK